MDAIDFVNEWVHDLKPYSPGKTIKGAVKMASNENSYGPSPKVVEGLRDKIKDVYRYPHKGREARASLADYAGVKPEQIVLGNGSDEILELIIKAFRGPVASHHPTFLEYPSYARIHHRGYIQSPLEEGFGFDAQRFIDDAEQASLLFLCTPNNPTGTVIEEQDLRRVLDECKPTVVDEAYFEFHGESVVDLLDEYPNLIISRTLAKSFGLAGLRIGYLISSPEIAEAVSKVKAPFNVNYLAHEAVLLALDDVEYMRKTVEAIRRDREKLFDKLNKDFRPIPSETNFILVDVTPYTCGEFFEEMLEQGIVVRRFGRFKGFEGNWIRITVGTERENQKLFKALETLE